MTDMSLKLEPEIITGAGVLSRIGAVAAGLGGKALIISGQSQFEDRLADRTASLLDDAGVDMIRFDSLPILAAADSAIAAGDIARGSRASLIIALGDSTVQSLAKTVAATALSRQDIYDFLDGHPPQEPFLPLVSVPTSMGDPFLFARHFILGDPRDRLAKLVQSAPGVQRTVFIDSGAAASAPEKYSGAGAFDGFLAALESWCSTRAAAVSDALLERALSCFGSLWGGGFAGTLDGGAPDFSAGSTGVPDDDGGIPAGDTGDAGDSDAGGALPDADVADLAAPVAGSAGFPAGPSDPAEAAIQGACLLAMGAAVSPPGLGIALAWSISSRFPVDRAAISAALLPWVVERLAAARPEKAAKAAYLAGLAAPDLPVVEGASLLAGGIRQALQAAGIPLRLRESGLNLDRMASAAEAARALEFVSWSPWTITAEDVWELLKAAY